MKSNTSKILKDKIWKQKQILFIKIYAKAIWKLLNYDYCHQLQSMLRQYNDSSTVTPLNIAYWEQNLTCDIDSLIGAQCLDKDLIIILSRNYFSWFCPHTLIVCLKLFIHRCYSYEGRIIKHPEGNFYPQGANFLFIP